MYTIRKADLRPTLSLSREYGRVDIWHNKDDGYCLTYSNEPKGSDYEMIRKSRLVGYAEAGRVRWLRQVKLVA